MLSSRFPVTHTCLGLPRRTGLGAERPGGGEPRYRPAGVGAELGDGLRERRGVKERPKHPRQVPAVCRLRPGPGRVHAPSNGPRLPLHQ